MSKRTKYLTGQEEVDRQQEEYDKLAFVYQPFELSDEQLLELGRKYYLCLTTQDYETRLHDYPIDDSNNKPWKYLQGYPEGNKVLLLGVGSGREVLAAEAMGLDAYGVTMGSNNINFGKAVLGISDERLVEGCVELLPFGPNTFDVVAGFQLFEHSISPLVLLLEQGRVLKMGGEIIFEWPAASAHGTNGADPQHQVCYTPGQAEGLLLKAGFGNIRIYYVDMTPVPKEKYWEGEQSKGYLVAVAEKRESKVDYINRSRDK